MYHSNQPQPTTGEWECPDCHTRKPMTGEWKLETDIAALAAAVESAVAELITKMAKLEQQLDAEREKVRTLVDALNDMFGMIEEGQLVRDISLDADPDYFKRATMFTRRLLKNQDALAKVKEGKVS